MWGLFSPHHLVVLNFTAVEKEGEGGGLALVIGLTPYPEVCRPVGAWLHKVKKVGMKAE